MSRLWLDIARHPPTAQLPAAGLVLALFGIAWLASQAMQDGVAGHAVIQGWSASLITGLATGLGALPIFYLKRVSQAAQDGMLGFAAGVMLAATSFSLLLPSLEAAERLLAHPTLAALLVAFGVLLGAGVLWGADRIVPHAHFSTAERPDADTLRHKQIWLFVLAIALHNIPEGLAVGLAYGGQEPGAASVALGIGIQNMPEGLAVALALLSLNYSRMQAFNVALWSGLAEPVAGLLGAGLVTVSTAILPLGLAFSAGAMLFVISHEIIPESHRQGHQQAATLGVMLGFVLMMLLDTTLG